MKLVTQVASTLLQMGSIKFSNPGSLRSARTIPTSSFSAAAIKHNLRIGPFSYGTRADMPLLMKQPLHSLIDKFLKLRIEWEGKHPTSCSPFDLGVYRVLIVINNEMREARLFRNEDESCVFFHPDFEARNIMVDRTPIILDKSQEHSANGTIFTSSSVQIISKANEWTITGVLDWDDSLSVPKVLTRAPPTFLWLEKIHERRKRAGTATMTYLRIGVLQEKISS